MSYIGKNPKWNSSTYTPQSSDPSNPTEGMVFYSDGTPRAEGLWRYDGATWINVQASSIKAITTKTANYTATLADDVILCNPSGIDITITLPTASGNDGKEFIIKKINSSYQDTVTIDGNGAETIDGDLTKVMYIQNEAITLISDGSNWQILERKIPSNFENHTPTGSWTTNTTYSSKFRREGDSFDAVYSIDLSGAPNAAALSVNMPTGLNIDTSKLEFTPSGNCTVGMGQILDTGSSRIPIRVVAFSSDPTILAIQFLEDIGTSVAMTTTTNTDPITFANGDSIQFFVEVPITEWDL